jgi:hypothetical protein
MFRSPEKGCQNFGGIKPKPRMTLLSKPRASISLADFCIYLQINPWKSKNSRSFGPQKRRKLFFEKDQAYVPVGSAAIDCLHVTNPVMGSSGQINRGSRARSAAERVESGGQDVESKQDRAFFRGGSCLFRRLGWLSLRRRRPICRDGPMSGADPRWLQATLSAGLMTTCCSALNSSSNNLS